MDARAPAVVRAGDPGQLDGGGPLRLGGAGGDRDDQDGRHRGLRPIHGNPGGRRQRARTGDRRLRGRRPARRARAVDGGRAVLPDHARAARDRPHQRPPAPGAAGRAARDASIDRWPRPRSSASTARPSGRVRIAVSPSIPGLCSDELLRGLAALAGEHGVGMHTHVAESRVQLAHAERRWGQPIVSALDGLRALPPGFTAAHGVWLAPAEIRALAKAGATRGSQPGQQPAAGERHRARARDARPRAGRRPGDRRLAQLRQPGHVRGDAAGGASQPRRPARFTGRLARRRRRVRAAPPVGGRGRSGASASSA